MNDGARARKTIKVCSVALSSLHLDPILGFIYTTPLLLQKHSITKRKIHHPGQRLKSELLTPWVSHQLRRATPSSTLHMQPSCELHQLMSCGGESGKWLRGATALTWTLCRVFGCYIAWRLRHQSKVRSLRDDTLLTWIPMMLMISGRIFGCK